MLTAAVEAASHIVVFHEDVEVNSAVADLKNAHGLGVEHTYRHALRGMAAVVPEGRLNALERDPRIASVEANQEVHTFAETEVPTGVQRIFADDNANITIDGNDDHRIDVDVAVIDTGIDLDHPDLNVATSTDCSGGSPFKAKCGDGGDDDNGHGTHVAGTIGAVDNGTGVVGVAPGARLHSVKVLDADGSGYVSWIVAGIDHVTATRTDDDPSNDIEVANMSLGFAGSNSALDEAITNSVAAGITYAVAAGNSADDATNYSPANHPDVITVSALADTDGEAGGLGDGSSWGADDTLASFSNYGDAIDIAAPGVDIESTYPGGYNTLSGTSMASPHVAGAAALLAASDSYTPAQIRDTILAEGNFDWTDDSGDGIHEPLLDVKNTEVFAPATVDGTSVPSDTTPPDAPTGLTVSAPSVGGEDGKLELNWDDNDDSDGDLAGYNIYRSTTSGSGYSQINSSLLESSSYIDSALVDGTTYYYVVNALDTSGNSSDNSDEASGDATNTVAPETPTDLIATAGDGQVSLDWADNQESDLEGYYVYRSTTSESGYSQINSSLLESSSYTDSSVDNDTTYYYVVSAADNSANESVTSTEVSATPTASSTTTMHVADLDGSSKTKGRSGKWEALVTVTIHDSDSQPVASASVSGEWTDATTNELIATVAGTTDESGNVALSSGNTSTSHDVTFTVQSVSVSDDSLEYEPPADPDSITIANPLASNGSVAQTLDGGTRSIEEPQTIDKTDETALQPQTDGSVAERTTGGASGQSTTDLATAAVSDQQSYAEAVDQTLGDWLAEEWVGDPLLETAL